MSQKEIPISPTTVITIARSWIGTPYLHQASAKGAGSDCLGLIRGVWRELYGAEPEAPPAYTPDWSERVAAREGETLLLAAQRNLIEREDKALTPGCVVVFRVDPKGPAKHCAIATSEERFIHAYAGRAAVESWMNRWWRARIAGVFSFPGVEMA